MYPYFQTDKQYKNIGGHLVNKALLKSNKKRIKYDYHIGQKILKYDNYIAVKLALKSTGPFEISHFHTNGTVTITLFPEV